MRTSLSVSAVVMLLLAISTPLYADDKSEESRHLLNNYRFKEPTEACITDYVVVKKHQYVRAHAEQIECMDDKLYREHESIRRLFKRIGGNFKVTYRNGSYGGPVYTYSTPPECRCDSEAKELIDDLISRVRAMDANFKKWNRRTANSCRCT